MTDHQTPLDIVRRRYPNALSTGDTVDAFLDLMERRLGIEPRKIMLADSICSDDLNTIEYPKRAYEMLGPFKLGGLDGFPFAGLTGSARSRITCRRTGRSSCSTGRISGRRRKGTRESSSDRARRITRRAVVLSVR